MPLRLLNAGTKKKKKSLRLFCGSQYIVESRDNVFQWIQYFPVKAVYFNGNNAFYLEWNCKNTQKTPPKHLTSKLNTKHNKKPKNKNEKEKET